MFIPPNNKYRNKYREAGIIVFCLAVLTCIIGTVQAQIFPVQTTTQLVPPYSVYLSDYATPGNEKLRVILLQRDLTQPSYQLRLVMRIELNGKEIIRTARTYAPAPINLSPGIPTVISGADLAPYLDSRNMDFTGYSREQYERTKSLPEGSYQITFTAYDYRRQDVQVSNIGTSFYYLSKSEPPLINFPACGTRIPMRTPQQLIFSWLARNTASPNSVAETQYELALYETRPEGRNPNDVVLSSQPVFRVTVDMTQYVYSPADPMLIEGMKYVWRVRAIDRNGKDAFRNNGYSEVCTFTYGGIDPDFDIGVVQKLQAEGETERRGRIWWAMGEYDGYRVNYRKTGEGYEWFTANVTTDELKQAGKTEGEVKVFDLEPDTEYETRVQVKKGGFFGNYSELVKFRTQPLRIAVCGQNPTMPAGDATRPLRSAIKGMIITVEDTEVQLMEILHLGDGWYKGTGRVSIDYLGGAVFPVMFERLFIDESRVAGLGRIEFVTDGVAALVAQQMTNVAFNNRQRQQEDNREAWAGTDFYDRIFMYDQIEIDSVALGNGGLVLTDNQGNTTINTEILAILTDAPEKAIIIQDKNDDQYVVQKDAATGEVKLTKVEGGGLGSSGNPFTTESLDIVKKALRELRSENGNSVIQSKKSELDRDKNELMKLIAENNSKLTSGSAQIVTGNAAPQGLFFDFKPAEVVEATETPFDVASKRLKQIELDYNRMIVIRFITDDMDNKDDYRLIAAGLYVNERPVSDFVTSQMAENKPEAETITAVKQAITLLINKIFINYSNNEY